ncbi:hypothetical protein PYW07_011563 [Mythimna separata]|uniref:Uncharacterized protein n=1 Tax=Mythimna separata TaxID=271217 RepID=A0AAD7Y9N4_MYTSE|nr:hypothetical protein PYW07_011563 [Mythimna separata]
MEAAYAKLQKEGKNNVDNLVNWMKDSKIIDQSQVDRVRTFFDDAADKKDVTLGKFKEVVGKVAEEFNTNVEEITKKLTKNGSKFLMNVLEGASTCLTDAAKNLFGKKK